MSGNQFFKDRIYSCWWKLIFWLVEIIFFHCFRYFFKEPLFRLVETHFSFQKKKYCFLFGAFFPASGNHYLNHRGAYLKLLLLLLAIIFFDFSDNPVNGSSVETYSYTNFPFPLVETDFLFS